MFGQLVRRKGGGGGFEAPGETDLILSADLTDDETGTLADLLRQAVGIELDLKKWIRGKSKLSILDEHLVHTAGAMVVLNREPDEDVALILEANALRSAQHPNGQDKLWEMFSNARKFGLDEGRFHLMRTLAEMPNATVRFMHEYAHLLRRKRRNGDALQIYDRIVAAFPRRVMTRFERARLFLAEGRPKLAKLDFDAVEPFMQRNPAFHYERGLCHESLQMEDEARSDFEQAIRLAPPDARAALRISEMHMRLNDREAALDSLKTAVAIKPRDAELRMKRARLFSEVGDWTSAVRDAEVACFTSGNSPQTQRFFNDVKARRDLEIQQKRKVLVLKSAQVDRLSPQACFELEENDLFEVVGVYADAKRAKDARLFLPDGESEPFPNEIVDLMNATEADSVWFVDADGDFEALGKTLKSLSRGLILTVAFTCETIPAGAPPKSPLVDASFLKLLLSRPSMEGQTRTIADARTAFDNVSDYCNARTIDDSDKSRPVHVHEGEAWLVSNSGINAFGGVEHFLRGMHSAYQKSGVSGVIIGFVEGETETGDFNGIPFINTSRDPAGLMDLILSRRPQIVHGTTGVGYELLSITRYLRCSFVYGSHFWRDMMYGSGWFKDIDKFQNPRSDFEQLATLAEHPYSNSVYTSEMVHKHFVHMQDILYSLPFELEDEELIARAEDPAARKGGYVLLLNARPEKGFDMVLELAPRCPDIEFVCVASQSGRDMTERVVESRGLKNIRVIDRVADSSDLYRNARVVLVPSFSFVETFSRVVIEAHRHGLPVIGADRGNVPLLLETSGGALPEDADLWYEELRCLYDDEDYYADRSRAALENSNAYPMSLSDDAVDRFVRAHRQRVAVAVGSGIGNVVQTLPVLLRLAKHYQAPIDVLVSSDFDQSVCTLRYHPAVANTYVYDNMTANRAYDVLIVLDCFGRIPPTNFARTIVNTRDYTAFSQMRTMSESEFNLLGVQKALDIDYEERDIRELDMRFGFPHAPHPKRIGIHGGSKKDIYAAKQWPFYPELVELLVEAGYEVHSFGVPDEYVEGCVDRTGTPLIESISNMATCSAFIANDSGLMHIADALHIPLVTVFAPTSVVKNGPLSETSKVIAVEKSCSPCQFDREVFARCKCIREITMGTVLARLRDIGVEV